MAATLTALLLPPFGLVLLGVLGGLLAWRGSRRAGLVAAAAAALVLLLATPWAANALRQALETRATPTATPPPPPAAIIVLGADQRRLPGGHRAGPLGLERMLQAARLSRATGLPVLVTGGPLSPGATPIAVLMAESLRADFAVAARWIEPAAPDTAGNARESVALLRAEGIGSAYVVTHAWHMPRALEAFARQGFFVVPSPVPPSPAMALRASDLVPRPDHLAESWLMLREMAGILVYRLRDGPPRAEMPRQ